MNNTGSDNPVDEPLSETSTANRRIPTRIIILGVVAIVFALVIGSQVIGVLYAIFFPPAAPIPDQVTLVSHTSKDYGVDDWLYSSSKLSACEVLRFFQSKDGQCRVAPLACPQEEAIQSPSVSGAKGQNVARCVATQSFSIFALRWEVIIATGIADGETSQFRLNREIFWTGAVPPSNPPSLDGGFPQSSTEDPPPTSAS